MKIPKKILKTIHNIEDLGSSLSSEENKLYNWLNENGINTDFYDNNSLDFELHELFQNNDGKDLIKKLEEL